MIRRMRRPLQPLLRQTGCSLMHQSTNFHDMCLLLASHSVGVRSASVPLDSEAWREVLE